MLQEVKCSAFQEDSDIPWQGFEDFAGSLFLVFFFHQIVSEMGITESQSG